MAKLITGYEYQSHFLFDDAWPCQISKIENSLRSCNILYKKLCNLFRVN